MKKQFLKSILGLSVTLLIATNAVNVSASTTTKNTAIWQNMNVAERNAYGEYIKKFAKNTPGFVDVDFADVNLDGDLEPILFVESFTLYGASVVDISIIDYKNGKVQEIYENIGDYEDYIGPTFSYRVLEANGQRILTTYAYSRYNELSPSEEFFKNAEKVGLDKTDYNDIITGYGIVEDNVLINGELVEGVRVVHGNYNKGTQGFYEFYYDEINNVYIPETPVVLKTTVIPGNLVTGVDWKPTNKEDYVFDKNVVSEAISLEKMSKTVKPQKINLKIDGKNESVEVYNINNNNYFKLRDVATLLSETDSKFNVDYDNNKKATIITTGESYNGTIESLSSEGKPYVEKATKIFVDGKEVSGTGYNIDGYMYYKIRDIGTLLNFSVDWDKVSNSVIIKTK